MPIAYPASVLVAYATKGKLNAFPIGANQQIYTYNARAFNNTGSAQNVGICRNHQAYKVWTLVGSTYTDQSASVSGGIVAFTTTNNDGILIQDSRRFNLLGLTISAASGGGTYLYQYWTGAAFATLTTLEVPVYSATGDVWIVWQAPSDWVIGGPTALDQDKYTIKVSATTHPTTAVSITASWVAEFLEFYMNAPSNSAVQLSFPDTKPYLLNGGEGLFPYYATAGATNQFGSYYSTV